MGCRRWYAGGQAARAQKILMSSACTFERPTLCFSALKCVCRHGAPPGQLGSVETSCIKAHENARARPHVRKTRSLAAYSAAGAQACQPCPRDCTVRTPWLTLGHLALGRTGLSESTMLVPLPQPSLSAGLTHHAFASSDAWRRSPCPCPRPRPRPRAHTHALATAERAGGARCAGAEERHGRVG